MFWEAVGSRNIVVLDIKCHQDEATAVASGLEALHWRANALADELAEEGARVAQLPAASIEEVRRLDKEAQEVQEHLAAVALEVAKRAPLLYGANTKPLRQQEASARAQQRRRELEEAARLTTHRLCPRSGRCLACLAAPTQEVPKLDFLRALCPCVPQRIHPTHKLRKTRGLWWCAECGGTGSTHFPKLGKECKRPSETGKRALSKLLDGQRPYHVREWPEAEEDLILI